MQGFIQTPRGGGGYELPLVFMQHPLTCIQQREVIRGCKPRLRYYNRQEAAMNQYTVSMTVTNL